MGLPPTSTKGSSDSNPVTTFEIIMPNTPITHSGVAATIGPVGIADGGTGQITAAAAYNALSPMTTTGDIEYEVSNGVAGRLPIGTANQVLQVNAGGTAPTWGSGSSLSYAQAYFTGSSTWSTSSSSFVDPTNSGGNSLTVRQSSGLTLTAAASNLPGITFTPSSASSVYEITAQVGVTSPNATAALGFQLTDGTSVIVTSGGFTQQNVTVESSAVLTTIPLIGIYIPGTTSPVTVKLQALCSNGGTASIQTGSTGANTIEWSIRQVPTNIISSVSSSLIGALVTYGVYS